MKPLVILSLVLLIGCSNIKFDSTNYDRILSLHQQSTHLKNSCSKSMYIRDQLVPFQQQAAHIALYSKLRTGSPEVANSTSIISEMVDEVVKRYTEVEPSLAYCKTKFDAIEAATLTVASTLGAQQ